MATSYSKIEVEVIFLRAITDLIDSMVNFAVFQVVGMSPDANILFHTSTHQKLFNILLVDLLSTSDKRLVGRQVSYLDALRGICNQPSFDVASSIANLRSAVASFTDWLSFEPTVDVWLPSADSEVQLTLPRSTFIRICGNVSKHSILRQSRPAEELRALLEQAGVSLTLDGAVLALEDFFERFHTDIFNYHASRIAELLNEIQWGVYDYLLPEYQRSYVYEGGAMRKYHFCYPDEVRSDLAKSLYWDLMNWIRRKPIVERFAVTKYLKMRY
jgi:hypothetical protein